MRNNSGFSITALVRNIELLNSRSKFKIDKSFGIHIYRTVIPSVGGSKSKHVFTVVDRKHFVHCIVSVSFGDKLCVPVALVLGKYRSMLDVREKGVHSSKRNNHLIKKSRPKRFEWMAKQIVEKCG